MAKLTYFPLLIDKWVGGTQELSFEERGYYISLLVWMYDSGKPVKDSDHAARILRCDRRTSRRLLAKLRPKFYLTSAGLRHKLCDKVLRINELEPIRSPQYLSELVGLNKPDLNEQENQWVTEDLENGMPLALKIQDPKILEEERKTLHEDMKSTKKEEVFELKPTEGPIRNPSCPLKQIVALYHEMLCPPMPMVEKLTRNRAFILRQRWVEDLPAMLNWKNFFAHVAKSDFLMGRCEPGPGRSKPFLGNLEWITKPANFAKIAEGYYNNVRREQPKPRRHIPADIREAAARRISEMPEGSQNMADEHETMAKRNGSRR